MNEIEEEDWQQVEIIGWLYQFYISEKKDEVIGKVVASEDIPAATIPESAVRPMGEPTTTGMGYYGTEGATIPEGFGSPEAIGKLLLERFLIPFEAASLLLLIAAVIFAETKFDPRTSPAGAEGLMQTVAVTVPATNACPGPSANVPSGLPSFWICSIQRGKSGERPSTGARSHKTTSTRARSMCRKN